MIALLLPLVLAPGQDACIERHLAAMGTRLTVEVTAPERALALAASERAVRALAEVERRLSTWRDDSELAHLNATPVGETIEISRALADELAAAGDVCRATAGAFDPGVGALVAAWDLRGDGRIPRPEDLAAALAASGFETLVWTRLAEGRARVERRSAGMRLEEGGFGKGAGLDRALDALRAAGITTADLDLGGQVAVLRPPGAEGKLVPIAHPDRRGSAVAEIRLTHGSLATSGNSERGLVIDGERFGHLLDPRTGRPAPDFGSLTVRAASALAADAFSTGLYVLGPDAALAFAASREDLEVLVLERSEHGLRIRATPGLDVRVLHPDLALEVVHPPSASQKAPTDR